MSVPAQLTRGLDDGIEPPASDPVEEQPHEDALVQEAGSGLEAGAGEEEEGEDVVVDAEVVPGEDDHEEEEGGHGGVDGEVFAEAAFEAEVPCLTYGDSDDGQDDAGEGEVGAFL